MELEEDRSSNDSNLRGLVDSGPVSCGGRPGLLPAGHGDRRQEGDRSRPTTTGRSCGVSRQQDPERTGTSNILRLSGNDISFV